MSDIIPQRLSEIALIRIRKYVDKNREKSGTTLNVGREARRQIEV